MGISGCSRNKPFRTESVKTTTIAVDSLKQIVLVSDSIVKPILYTSVSGLAKDSNGVWRGTATKDGRSQNVAIDFRGNIVISQN